MAELSIYTGFWINWSKGPILGATLTTTSQDGFLLVSFLALFVRMVGGHFWSVLCFVMHQLKSDLGSQDGLRLTLLFVQCPWSGHHTSGGRLHRYSQLVSLHRCRLVPAL